MAREDVQILSQTDDDGVRIYQLSPKPDMRWWRAFQDVATRRRDEVGMGPGASIETGHGDDEIRISGITPETSIATDQWLGRVVVATNRQLRAES